MAAEDQDAYAKYEDETVLGNPAGRRYATSPRASLRARASIVCGNGKCGGLKGVGQGADGGTTWNAP